jgi:hypothetical protein
VFNLTCLIYDSDVNVFFSGLNYKCECTKGMVEFLSKMERVCLFSLLTK